MTVAQKQLKKNNKPVALLQYIQDKIKYNKLNIKTIHEIYMNNLQLIINGTVTNEFIVHVSKTLVRKQIECFYPGYQDNT